METEITTMKPSDLEIPQDGIVFIFGGEEEMAMAYIGTPKMSDQLRAEAIYKLLADTNADGKQMMTATIRGLSMLNMRLH